MMQRRALRAHSGRPDRAGRSHGCYRMPATCAVWCA